jgi:hypothetical protein
VALIVVPAIVDLAEGRRVSESSIRFAVYGSAVVVLLLLFGVALGPIGFQRHPEENAAMQNCRTLALAEFQCANDNNGSYPDGASSTDVFQKLLDGHYINDPTICYVPMAGKRPGEQDDKLKPENVCFDVTEGVTSNSPGALPLVFLTGYRIDYRPGGSATSLIKPFPWAGPANWIGRYSPMEGFAVAYVNNNSFFKDSETAPPSSHPLLNADGFGGILNVVPPDLKQDGASYRQLTPEGVLK